MKTIAFVKKGAHKLNNYFLDWDSEASDHCCPELEEVSFYADFVFFSAQLGLMLV